MTVRKKLSGWGKWPVRDCNVAPLSDAMPSGTSIARGLGRAYGDSAINPDLTLLGPPRNRVLAFDEDTGVLRAQGGLSSAEILEVFVPRGWFLPVTPGTKFVTLAGMLAVDAHGKNHHKVGSIGDHVLAFDLLCADGELRSCSLTENRDLFQATIGGNGLTGHIMTVTIGLIPIESAWIKQRTLPAANLDEAIEIFENNADATYSVAWIDCLAAGENAGRSLILLGEHATLDDLSGSMKRNKPLSIPKRPEKRMPINAPAWALNKHTIRAFNKLYYGKGVAAPADALVDYDSYFYPLDAIHDWNKLYGKQGFAQYQCALPLEHSRNGLLELLDAIAVAGLGSFLAVLKRFGQGAPERLLSFPMEGYTLALDFSLSPGALTLLDQLDEITVRHGGRLYLAKDSRMTQATFEAGYGDAVPAFRELRKSTGADQAFKSLQSERLKL